MLTTAILVAAGPGIRLGAGEPKAFVLVRGIPLFIRSLRAVTATPAVSAAVVVVPPGEEPRGRNLIDAHGPWRCPVSVTEGGTVRQASVGAGLRHAAGADLIAIHDAARPFVATEVIESVIAAAARYGAAIVAIPATDTVKQVHEDGWVESTLPRNHVWLAQTPQVFRADILRAAHEQAPGREMIATDDAMLVERLGARVHVVPGNFENRKITTPEDRSWAEWLLERAREPR